MALELRQQLKLAQQLIMTPQLQQAIKLLQLSRIELIETIDQELEANPVLEESESEDIPYPNDTDRGNLLQEKEPSSYEETRLPTLASSELEKIPWEDKAIQDINWKDFWDEDNRTLFPAYSFEKKEAPSYENIFTCTTDLREHLMWQLQMSHFNDIERQSACLIIGNLDRNGYLKTTVDEIAEEVGCVPEQVEGTLKKIQLFDPVGVAARDLRECLLIQIGHLGINNPLVSELVSKHLNHIERHNYQAMARATGRSLEEIAKAIEIITALEPCPGRPFSNEEIHYIVPDIYVYKVDDEYTIVLNDDGLPRLRISSFYRSAIKNGITTSSAAKDFIQDKLKSAMWLIRSIQQRQKTIYRVTKSIVKFQREFLDRGIAYLKPLILRDVADDIEMHESTVSRVTTNKYVHTPQGIFELKFFFSASLGRDDGSDVASYSVKERIRQLIQSEDPIRPYSDLQIAEILARDHIRIARRTVAKYRDLMGILPSSRRKRPAIN